MKFETRQSVWKKYNIDYIQDNMIENRGTKDKSQILMITRGNLQRIDLSNMIHYLTGTHLIQKLDDKGRLMVGEIRKLARGERQKETIIYNSEKVKDFINFVSKGKIEVINPLDIMEKNSIELIQGSNLLHVWVNDLVTSYLNNKHLDLDKFKTITKERKNALIQYIERKSESDYPEDYLRRYPFIAWETIVNCGLLDPKVDFILGQYNSIGLYIFYQELIFDFISNIKLKESMGDFYIYQMLKSMLSSMSILHLPDFNDLQGNHFIKRNDDGVLSNTMLLIMDPDENVEQKIMSCNEVFLHQLLKLLEPFWESKFDMKNHIDKNNRQDIYIAYTTFIEPYRNKLNSLYSRNTRFKNDNETNKIFETLIGESWKRYKKILKFLKQYPGASVKDISNSVGESSSTINVDCKNLVKIELLETIPRIRGIGYKIKDGMDRILMEIEL